VTWVLRKASVAEAWGAEQEGRTLNAAFRAACWEEHLRLPKQPPGILSSEALGLDWGLTSGCVGELCSPSLQSLERPVSKSTGKQNDSLLRRCGGNNDSVLLLRSFRALLGFLALLKEPVSCCRRQ